MVADLKNGEPEIKEPDKCERWEWFAWNALPEKLFLPLRNCKKQGFDPFTF
jgi:8-oxo-dGTP diphosphatase